MHTTDKHSVCLSRRRRFLIEATALVLLAGCEDTPIPAQTDIAKTRRGPDLGFIAFVGASNNDPLWPILHTGADRYARGIGKLEIRYFAPAGRSAQDQVDILETLRDPRMRGLCLQIIDVDAVMPILNRLYNQGILIVSMIQPAPERIRASHVGFDDEAVGRALAQLTRRALGGSGTIMLLQAGYEDPVFGPRLRAFEQEMNASRTISVLASLDCRRNPREARRIMRDRSARYPRLSAWVALADWPIRDHGQIQSLMPAGCGFITFGGTPDHWSLIRNRVSPGVVAANYRELGWKAVQFCESAILHSSRFKNSDHHVPLRILGPINLDQYTRDWTLWSTGQYETADVSAGDLPTR